MDAYAGLMRRLRSDDAEFTTEQIFAANGARFSLVLQFFWTFWVSSNLLITQGLPPEFLS